MLADNRIALNAGWDREMLSLELKDLSLLEADLGRLGFTAQELAQALSAKASGGSTDETKCRKSRTKRPAGLAISGVPALTASHAAIVRMPMWYRRFWQAPFPT